METIVAKSRASVYVYGKLEQIAEKTFNDVPYKIINGKAEEYDIMPKRFDITVRGGITAVSNVKLSDIELILDANDIYNSETATALLSYKIKNGLKIANTNMLYVYAFRNRNADNMIEFAQR